MRRLDFAGNFLLVGLSVVFAAFFFGNFYYFSLSSGSSMEPALSGVDLALMDMHTKDYSVGDIVWYKADPEKPCIYMAQAKPTNNCIQHRIVEELEWGYVLKGDNNPYNDPVVSKDAIRAEAIKHWDMEVLLAKTFIFLVI